MKEVLLKISLNCLLPFLPVTAQSFAQNYYYYYRQASIYFEKPQIQKLVVSI